MSLDGLDVDFVVHSEPLLNLTMPFTVASFLFLVHSISLRKYLVQSVHQLLKLRRTAPSRHSFRWQQANAILVTQLDSRMTIPLLPPSDNHFPGVDLRPASANLKRYRVEWNVLVLKEMGGRSVLCGILNPNVEV